MKQTIKPSAGKEGENPQKNPGNPLPNKPEKNIPVKPLTTISPALLNHQKNK